MFKRNKLKGRKYLNDLGTTGNCLDIEKDKRKGQWKKERKKYSFDERETWNLNTTMIELLYERVMMYKEINIVDTSFHKITIGEKTKTHRQWIDVIIDRCEKYISMEDVHQEELTEYENEIWTVWRGIAPYMWW